MKAADQLRRMGFNEDQISSATIHGVPLAIAEKSKPKQSDGWPGYKSKWEAMYSAELDYQKTTGEIVEWMYEPFMMKLTEPTIVGGKKVRPVRYTPDFVCWLPDGRMRCVEIKGYKREKAINMFKMAKDKFRQIEFIMLTRENGAWERLAY